MSLCLYVLIIAVTIYIYTSTSSVAVWLYQCYSNLCIYASLYLLITYWLLMSLCHSIEPYEYNICLLCERSISARVRISWVRCGLITYLHLSSYHSTYPSPNIILAVSILSVVSLYFLYDALKLACNQYRFLIYTLMVSHLSLMQCFCLYLIILPVGISPPPYSNPFCVNERMRMRTNEWSEWVV